MAMAVRRRIAAKPGRASVRIRWCVRLRINATTLERATRLPGCARIPRKWMARRATTTMRVRKPIRARRVFVRAARRSPAKAMIVTMLVNVIRQRAFAIILPNPMVRFVPMASVKLAPATRPVRAVREAGRVEVVVQELVVVQAPVEVQAPAEMRRPVAAPELVATTLRPKAGATAVSPTIHEAMVRPGGPLRGWS